MRRRPDPNYKAFFLTILALTLLLLIVIGIGSMKSAAKQSTATVRSSQFTSNPTRRSTPTPVPKYKYIGNRRSHVFHWPSCSSVRQMNEYNKVYLTSRDEALQKDYSPCGRCHP